MYQPTMAARFVFACLNIYNSLYQYAVWTKLCSTHSFRHEVNEYVYHLPHGYTHCVQLHWFAYDGVMMDTAV